VSWIEYKTRTGSILCDRERTLECLYVGDYGKENNIKADFLGLHDKIESVQHRPVDLTDKMVVTISTQKGCSMACKFCDCPSVPFAGNCSRSEMFDMTLEAIQRSGVSETKRFNLHFARMGEPTFNWDVLQFAMNDLRLLVAHQIRADTIHPVISTMMPKANTRLMDFLENWCWIKNHSYDGEAGLQLSINTLCEFDRNEMFNGRSLSLMDISTLSWMLPKPVGRKYTLNFAVTGASDLDPDKMDIYFDKKKFIIKITPIHATRAATDNGFEIVKDYDVYERFEKPLVNHGWDVIVFAPSAEEDADRITCGNAILKSGDDQMITGGDATKTLSELKADLAAIDANIARGEQAKTGGLHAAATD